jgi:hypothetical protein
LGHPRQRNSFKDYPDNKASLLRGQVLGNDVCVNAKTKRCLRIAKRFSLYHDLAKHRSSAASNDSLGTAK